MASPIQRATQGFAAVAVAATLVTVGAGVYESRQPTDWAGAADEGFQDVPRPFVTPPTTPPSPGPSPAPDTAETLLPSGLTLPATVYKAYRNAEDRLARSLPGCRLGWAVLAGIGQVESGQTRGGALTADGTTVEPILGPALDGDGFASVPDSDGGRLDGDTRWDRAVGPMQFIPTTWAVWGSDGNDDGAANPHNMYDAALSAGRYLCAGGRDLADPRQLREALLSYNRSDTYADTVLGWIARYAGTPEPDIVADTTRDPSPSPSESTSGTGSEQDPGPEDTTGPSPDSSTSQPPPDPAGPSPSESSDPPPGPSPSPSPSPPPAPSDFWDWDFLFK
ncbi:lytic transglycosylase domain-containing protein [Streptomyces sp. AS58]|uniref:lytic transglycosylase domain-containing protein n=1 Tax=Streptomyces sp. AS58 TaxID=1519489 RepID=UPI0006AFAC28|nr:lytic murein transglycosylase [Streptomyces sp. AS58]